MSFAEDVKNELCRYENTSNMAELIELSTLLRVRGSILLGKDMVVGMRFSTANNAVARRVLNTLKNNFSLKTSVMIRQGLNLRKKNMYNLTVEPSTEAKKFMESLKLWPPNEMIPNKWIKGLEEKRAFLRGTFLGGGSVNKPQSYYHLEFIASNMAFAKKIVYVLKQFQIMAKITERKDDYIVYIKDGDAVTSTLQVMGASGAMLAFEEVRVVKEVRNNINRQVNCETANLEKTVEAAMRQIEAINTIQKYQPLENLPAKLYELAKLRLDNPSASLQDLMDMMEGSISKSGINHRFKKIEEIAASYLHE